MTVITKKSDTKKNPELRFPRFSDEWEEKRIDETMERISDSVTVNDSQIYQEIGIRSHGRGIFHKPPVKGISLGNKRIYWIKKDMLILNIVFAWEQAVAKTTKNEESMVASHRFPMYQPLEGVLDLNFILRIFLTKKGKYLLGLASPGGAGRNKTLGQKAFNELKISLPTLPEQQKIADFLGSADEWINNLKLQKESLQAYKKGVMQKVFSQEIRFKNKNGKEFPEWEKKKLEEVFNTIPTKPYQIKNSEILNFGKYRVVNQGKKNIAGYSNEKNKLFKNNNVIIFGDHTTIVKYVNFDFIIGADGTKILKNNTGNLKFLYYNLIHNNIKSEGYKRHFSILKKIKITLPDLPEQKKIADFLTSIDNLIEAKQMQIRKAEQWKKGLMQTLFI